MTTKSKKAVTHWRSFPLQNNDHQCLSQSPLFSAGCIFYCIVKLKITVTGSFPSTILLHCDLWFHILLNSLLTRTSAKEIKRKRLHLLIIFS